MGLRYLLLTDGSSDRVLKSLIDITIKECRTGLPFTGEWVDRRILSRRHARSLTDRIKVAIESYGVPDILFVHRDAEREPLESRVAEILQAIRNVDTDMPWVAVVPVRMQEAWLLVDEHAIRSAAGNPNGKQSIHMPQPNTIERLADPKEMLHRILREASGLNGRRKKNFRVETASHRIIYHMTSISPLRELTAFKQFEESLRDALIEVIG